MINYICYHLDTPDFKFDLYFDYLNYVYQLELLILLIIYDLFIELIKIYVEIEFEICARIEASLILACKK